MSVDFDENGERRGPDLIDPTKYEGEAIDAAVKAAGAKIEAVGKMDILEWEPQEFDEMIRRAVAAYTSTLRERCKREAMLWVVEDDEIPF